MWRADAEQLAEQWRAALPFPHVVIDDVVAQADLDAMMAVLDEEPVQPAISDIFAFEATTPEPTTPAFRELRESFARDLAPVFSQAFGRPVSRVDMRAYAYRPGHYLLPHTDHQAGLGRVYAYAYYLPAQPAVFPAGRSESGPLLLGGELELYRCRSDGGELVDIASARRIVPRPNRLVVFEVGDHSLHQVREVLGGLRISLAGWFYP